MNANERIGCNLKALRGARSQEWLAERLRETGLNWFQSTIWKIEKGERPLKAAEAEVVAAALGATIDDLLRDPREQSAIGSPRPTAGVSEATIQAVAQKISQACSPHVDWEGGLTDAGRKVWLSLAREVAIDIRWGSR